MAECLNCGMLGLPSTEDFCSRRCQKQYDTPAVTDPLQPSPQMLCKLGSIVVHAEEFLSPTGHHLDLTAMRTLFEDKEVRQWIKDMGPMLPVKR